MSAVYLPGLLKVLNKSDAMSDTISVEISRFIRYNHTLACIDDPSLQRTSAITLFEGAGVQTKTVYLPVYSENAPVGELSLFSATGTTFSLKNAYGADTPISLFTSTSTVAVTVAPFGIEIGAMIPYLPEMANNMFRRLKSLHQLPGTISNVIPVNITYTPVPQTGVKYLNFTNFTIEGKSKGDQTRGTSQSILHVFGFSVIGNMHDPVYLTMAKSNSQGNWSNVVGFKPQIVPYKRPGINGSMLFSGIYVIHVSDPFVFSMLSGNHGNGTIQLVENHFDNYKNLSILERLASDEVVEAVHKYMTGVSLDDDSNIGLYAQIAATFTEECKKYNLSTHYENLMDEIETPDDWDEVGGSKFRYCAFMDDYNAAVKEKYSAFTGHVRELLTYDPSAITFGNITFAESVSTHIYTDKQLKGLRITYTSASVDPSRAVMDKIRTLIPTTIVNDVTYPCEAKEKAIRNSKIPSIRVQFATPSDALVVRWLSPLFNGFNISLATPKPMKKVFEGRQYSEKTDPRLVYAFHPRFREMIDANNKILEDYRKTYSIETQKLFAGFHHKNQQLSSNEILASVDFMACVEYIKTRDVSHLKTPYQIMRVLQNFTKNPSLRIPNVEKYKSDLGNHICDYYASKMLADPTIKRSYVINRISEDLNMHFDRSYVANRIADIDATMSVERAKTDPTYVVHTAEIRQKNVVGLMKILDKTMTRVITEHAKKIKEKNSPARAYVTSRIDELKAFADIICNDSNLMSFLEFADPEFAEEQKTNTEEYMKRERKKTANMQRYNKLVQSMNMARIQLTGDDLDFAIEHEYMLEQSDRLPSSGKQFSKPVPASTRGSVQNAESIIRRIISLYHPSLQPRHNAEKIKNYLLGGYGDILRIIVLIRNSGPGIFDTLASGETSLAELCEGQVIYNLPSSELASRPELRETLGRTFARCVYRLLYMQSENNLALITNFAYGGVIQDEILRVLSMYMMAPIGEGDPVEYLRNILTKSRLVVDESIIEHLSSISVTYFNDLVSDRKVSHELVMRDVEKQIRQRINDHFDDYELKDEFEVERMRIHTEHEEVDKILMRQLKSVQIDPSGKLGELEFQAIISGFQRSSQNYLGVLMAVAYSTIGVSLDFDMSEPKYREHKYTVHTPIATVDGPSSEHRNSSRSSVSTNNLPHVIKNNGIYVVASSYFI